MRYDDDCLCVELRVFQCGRHQSSYNSYSYYTLNIKLRYPTDNCSKRLESHHTCFGITPQFFDTSRICGNI